MLFLCLLIIAGYGLLIGSKSQNKTPLLFVCIISMAGMIMFNGSDFPIFDSQQIFKEAGSKRQRERRRERRNGNKLELRDLVPEETAKKIEAFQEANRKPWEEGYTKKTEEEPHEIRNIPADTIPALRNYEGGNKSTGNKWADEAIADAKRLILESIQRGDQDYAIPPNNYAFRAAARDLGDTYLITREPSGESYVRYDEQGHPIKLNGRSPEDVIREQHIPMTEGATVVKPETQPSQQPAQEPPKSESGKAEPPNSASGVKTPEPAPEPAEPKEPELSGAEAEGQDR